MTVRHAPALVLVLLAACSGGPPRDGPTPTTAEPGRLQVGERERGCFTIERVPPPEGGLAIPRQRVCAPFAPADGTRD